MRLRRRRPLAPGRGTLALGTFATVTFAAVVVVEVGRVWRRGRAPLPQETDDLLLAAEEAVAETAEVARVGYRGGSTRENSTFNLLGASQRRSSRSERSPTCCVRARAWGRSGTCASAAATSITSCPGSCSRSRRVRSEILARDERLEPILAVPFGVGLGLTLDESALLLELEDVYWSEEGLLSVQITLAVMAMLGALALSVRFLRRGEQLVLEPSRRNQ